MFELKEKVSYLNGLLDGLEISDATKEGKAIKAVAEVLNQIADALTAVSYTHLDVYKRQGWANSACSWGVIRGYCGDGEHFRT